jgi:hypothetical protein
VIAALGCRSEPRGAAAPWPSEPDGSAGVEALTTWLSTVARRMEPLDAGQLAAAERVARSRRTAMERLIREDPQLALALSLSPADRGRLPARVAEHVEAWLDGIGDLMVSVTETFEPAMTSQLQHQLRLDDRVLTAYVHGHRRAIGSKRAIPLHAITLGAEAALLDSPVRELTHPEADTDIRVDVGGAVIEVPTRAALEQFVELETQREARPGPDSATAGAAALTTALVADSQPSSPPISWTTGTKRVLVMRVDFSDRPGESVSAQEAERLVSTEVSDFYSVSSYGRTSLVGTATPLLRLPQPRSSYATLFDAIADARVAARNAGFDPDGYDLDLIAGDPSFTSNHGVAIVGGKGAAIEGAFLFSIVAHELGHNFGLNHASMWVSDDETPTGPGHLDEYGNEWDVMGQGRTAGSIFEPAARWWLGWLPDNAVTDMNTSGTYRVLAHDDASSAGTRVLRFTRDESSVGRFWLSVRQQAREEWPRYAGFLVRTQSTIADRTELLDLTPGDQTGNLNAPLAVGQSFTHPSTGVVITPIGLTGTTPQALDVVVNDPALFPGNRAPTGDFTASPLVYDDPNTLVTFQANVTDPDGDLLAYFWNVPGSIPSQNSATFTRKFTGGLWPVRAVVSDTKGKTLSRNFLVQVQSPRTVISGTVTSNGQPVEGAMVHAKDSSTGFALNPGVTDSRGVYYVAAYAGSFDLSPVKSGALFIPASRTVTVGSSEVSGVDFGLASQTVLIDETFDAPPAALTVVRGGTWSTSGGLYHLRSPATDVANGNLVVTTQDIVGDFTFTVDARALPATGWNDFSVVFSYRSSSDYWYASFNEGNDTGTNGIFHFLDGAMEERVDFTPLTLPDGTLHHVVIGRSGSTVTVVRDGAAMGTVTDATIGDGKLGIGSRNDSCDFDNFRVQGLGQPTSLTAAITAPTAGAQVRGIVRLAASATGAAGVQLFLDGAPVGEEDLSPPYEREIDSLALTGRHTVTARARASDGRTADADPVAFDVVNDCRQVDPNGAFSQTIGPFSVKFQVTWDSAPGAAPMDGGFGLSLGSASYFSSTSASVLFGSGSPPQIVARNGTTSTAVETVPYVAGQGFAFRMEVDPAAKTYSVFARAANGSEQVVARDYGFRSTRVVSTLDHWMMRADELSPSGLTVCNVSSALR